MANQQSLQQMPSIAFIPAFESLCGYCKENTHTTCYLQPSSITPHQSEILFNRGFRRCGCVFYLVDNECSCCSQFMMKCDPFNFRPSRSHRRVLKRILHYLGIDSSAAVSISRLPNTKAELVYNAISLGAQSLDKFEMKFKGKHKRLFRKLLKSNELPPVESVLTRSQHLDFDKCMAIILDNQQLRLSWTRAHPSGYLSPLDPTTKNFDLEAELDLYRKYESNVHQKANKTKNDFLEFLVKSYLTSSRTKEYLLRQELELGTYHLQYILNGKLLAVSVIDLMPTIFSSVYFIYDTDKMYKKLSLGIFSTLLEIYMVREARIHGGGIRSYSLGLYVPKCPKMRYKASYEPSFVLDEFQWREIDLQSGIKGEVRFKDSQTTNVIESVQRSDLDAIIVMLPGSYIRVPYRTVADFPPFLNGLNEDAIRKFYQMVSPEIAYNFVLRFW